MILKNREKAVPFPCFTDYSAFVQLKDRISPVFSFFTTSQLATLMRDWYLSFLGLDLE
jgi:hypothetical protein